MPPDLPGMSSKPTELDLSKLLQGDVNKKKREAQEKKNQKEKEDLYFYVLHEYPQYTLKQLYEEIPVRQIYLMAKAARRHQAEQLLILNNIINGPNVKSKTKKEYKRTIESLQRVLEDDKKKKVTKLL